MRLARLQPGDVVQCRVNGVVFTAHFQDRLRDGRVEVDPIPRWATWRRLRPSQVVRKLRDRQGRLDRVNILLIEPFGRVRVGELLDSDGRAVQLIGRSGDPETDGALVRCEVTCESGRVKHWDGRQWWCPKDRDRAFPEYGGRTLGDLELEAWDYMGGTGSDGRPLELPLIVLAGLR